MVIQQTSPRLTRAPRVLTSVDRRSRVDLRLGYLGQGNRPFGAATAAATGRIVARHAVHTTAADFSLMLVAPESLTRRAVSEALADAVAELRAIDVTYSPLRASSLVARLRRGEVAPDAYPPLADIVARCDAMRAATDGWFDAWAVPGGFDPSGLLKGWAVDRAATRLRAAGISDYAVVSEADLVVRGHAPHGGPWRVAVHGPDGPAVVLEMTEGAVGTSGLTGHRDHVVDPHTREPVRQARTAAVIGPDLSVADAYATALVAAGPAGRSWFPTPDGYRLLLP
ncbi:FAD:protein FMN transferase [Actinomycetes bacterium KLBMP 9797]